MLMTHIYIYIGWIHKYRKYSLGGIQLSSLVYVFKSVKDGNM